MKTNRVLNFGKLGIVSFVFLLVACNNKSNVEQEIKTEVVTAASVIPDYATDPNIDKDVRSFLKKLNSGGTSLEKLAPKEAQNVLVNAQAAVNVDLSGIDVSEKTITADGYTILLNIVKPKGVTKKLPVFMFIHGGGWILGDFPTHKRMVRDLVVQSGFTGVFINYTRTPEAKYPVAINEIYAATKWVAEHGDQINVDGKNLALVGNSVGGNMSIVTSLMAKEKNGPKIKGQILFWPIVDSDFNTDSYKRFGKDRFLTVPIMKWMYDMYITDPEQRKQIYASPLIASLDQLKGLPPTLIQTAENDVLLDEGEAFGRKLNEAGVQVTTTRYLGMIHDFGLLNGLANIPATRSAFAQAAGELKLYLKK